MPGTGLGDPLNGLEASAKVDMRDAAWFTEGAVARCLNEAACPGSGIAIRQVLLAPTKEGPVKRGLPEPRV